jgi:hypothetical protein
MFLALEKLLAKSPRKSAPNEVSNGTFICELGFVRVELTLCFIIMSDPSSLLVTLYGDLLLIPLAF